MKESLQVCIDLETCFAIISMDLADMTRIGKITEVGGIKTYVAIPEGDYAKNKAVLFLPGSCFRICWPFNRLIIADVFGLELINNKV